MLFRESQLARALRLLGMTFVGGGLGYYILGLLNRDVNWTLFDCFYMSTITLTTVGYGETLTGMDAYVAARVYTLFLLLFGVSSLAYAASAGTAFIVEGKLSHLLEIRRMNKRIAEMSGHYIVCGATTTGIHVVRELIETGKPFVVIEKDEDRIERVRQMGAQLIVEGDATADETLLTAGVERARGLAVCLNDDRDNLFVTVTARQYNREMRVVAQNVEQAARDKLILAGADSTVSPNLIGGLRLVSELIRPSVVTFLDSMLRGRNKGIRFAEVTVQAGSRLDGTTLREAKIHDTIGIPVLALRSDATSEFEFNPPGNARLAEGVVIVVMGGKDKVEALERWATT
jgi:voltage-gated potassium channel